MADTEKMLATMRKEPSREFTLDELLKLRGGSRQALTVCLARLVGHGTVARVGSERSGIYRFAGDVDAEPAPEKPRRAAPPPHAQGATHA